MIRTLVIINDNCIKDEKSEKKTGKSNSQEECNQLSGLHKQRCLSPCSVNNFRDTNTSTYYDKLLAHWIHCTETPITFRNIIIYYQHFSSATSKPDVLSFKFVLEYMFNFWKWFMNNLNEDCRCLLWYLIFSGIWVCRLGMDNL